MKNNKKNRSLNSLLRKFNKSNELIGEYFMQILYLDNKKPKHHVTRVLNLVREFESAVLNRMAISEEIEERLKQKVEDMDKK